MELRESINWQNYRTITYLEFGRRVAVLIAAACRCAFKLDQILLQVWDWFRPSKRSCRCCSCMPSAGPGPFIPQDINWILAPGVQVESCRTSTYMSLLIDQAAWEQHQQQQHRRTFNAVPPMSFESQCQYVRSHAWHAVLIPVACLPCWVNTLVVRSFASCLTLEQLLPSSSIKARTLFLRIIDWQTYPDLSTFGMRKLA